MDPRYRRRHTDMSERASTSDSDVDLKGTSPLFKDNSKSIQKGAPSCECSFRGLLKHHIQGTCRSGGYPGRVLAIVSK